MLVTNTNYYLYKKIKTKIFLFSYLSSYYFLPKTLPQNLKKKVFTIYLYVKKFQITLINLQFKFKI